MAGDDDVFWLGARAGLEKVALGVAGHKDSGALWWKKREHYVGDTDKDAVDSAVARWKRQHPGARVKRTIEGVDGRGRTWHNASMRVKRASAKNVPGAALASLTKARQRTPAASLTKKPKPQKPSRQLGLGEQTMAMGDVATPAQRLQQPPKPPRY